MPLKSKAQFRMLKHLEGTGDVAEGTASKWYHHTPGKFKNLPEHVGGKKGAGPVTHRLTSRGTHRLLDCPAHEAGHGVSDQPTCATCRARP